MDATWQFERRTAVSRCNPFSVITWGPREKHRRPSRRSLNTIQRRHGDEVQGEEKAKCPF